MLAVVAAPKFIDIQSDATASTLKGVKAAIQGGSQLVYAKAAIAGLQNAPAGASSQVTVNGSQVNTDFGYPDSETTDTLADLGNWVDLSANDFTLVAGRNNNSAGQNRPGRNSFGITPANNNGVVDFRITAVDGLSCHVLYTEAVDQNTSAQVTTVTGGC